MNTRRFAGLWPVPVVVAGVAMLRWGWLRWPDPWIDFGRELYVPWRLVAGETLYADLAYLNGPLSPHLNALAFDLFGVGLHTLAAVDVTLAVALGALLLRELARLAGPAAACVAGLFYVCAFAFGQLLGVGNYNFVTPYSHEMTHGLALGAVAVLASVRGGGPARAVLAGLALGLCFLTKAEVFVAAAGGVAVAQGLAAAGAVHPLRDATRRAAWLVGGGALPVALALGLLGRRMPFDAALLGTLGAWRYAFDPELASLRFYRQAMGTLDVGDSLLRLGLGALALAAVLGASAGSALALPRRAARLAAAVVAIGGSAWLLGSGDRIVHVVRPLPVVLVALGVLGALRWRSSDAGGRTIEAARLAWIAWSLLLLARIVLNVRLSHYGFALAMPATLIAVGAWVGVLPRQVEHRGGDGAAVRATALALAACALLALLRVTGAHFGADVTWVGDGPDRFAAQRRGAALARAIDAVEQHVKPDETLAVLPEGILLNYLTRRVNPTGHLNFMPPELILFGEDAIVTAFRDRPPDFVLLAHKSTAEYGLPLFGRDYGRALHRLVSDAYRPVWQLGAVPLTGPRYGLQLLERSDRSDARGEVGP